MMEQRIRRILGLPGRAFKLLLCYAFDFDKWHINTLHDRKYARDIIRYLNSKQATQRTSVAEIGCGLGDILRSLDYEQKTGYDLDPNALKAAAFLAKCKFEKITFDYFKFPDSKLSGVFDTIIMVNWIHHVPPQLLKSKIEEYYNMNLSQGGEIVIDTVQDPEYEINHSIGFLVSGLNCSRVSISKDIRQREVFAIRKNQDN